MQNGGGEYAHILALARSGETARAWELFTAAKLHFEMNDPRALTLKGRLLKDRARQETGAKRTELLIQSATAYEQAAALHPDSYPLINAAAMALFAGDRIRSELLASKVLHLIESGTDQGETPYWREATRAEALLLLGRSDDAKVSLSAAIKLAPNAWEDRASTLRQFAQIHADIGSDASWLHALRPPPSLHFSGMLGIAADDRAANEAIRDAVHKLVPGWAFGALAAGADILAAEAAIAVGASLHVVLPAHPSDFRNTSVEPLGSGWIARFEALLESAETLTIVNGQHAITAASVTLAEYHAMGLTIEKALQLETRALALRVGPDGQAKADDLWLESKRPIIRVPAMPSTNSNGTKLPSGTLIFNVAIAGELLLQTPSLGEAAKAIRAAVDKTVVVDCQTGDNVEALELSQHGVDGLVTASRDVALALLAAGCAARIETIGEISLNSGAKELCLVTLSADAAAR